jgi:hypothetical protein
MEFVNYYMCILKQEILKTLFSPQYSIIDKSPQRNHRLSQAKMVWYQRALLIGFKTQ